MAIISALVIVMVAAVFFLTRGKSTDTRNKAATGAGVNAYLSSTGGSTTGSAPIEVNLILEPASTIKISGATVLVKYDSTKLTVAETTMKDSAGQANGTCRDMNFKLDNVINLTDDQSGNLKLSKVSVKTNNELPVGKTCFTTLTFVPKADATGTAAITLDPTTANWEIVGPEPSYSVTLTNPSTYTVTFGAAGTTVTPSATRAPQDTLTPTPTATSVPTATSAPTATVPTTTAGLTPTSTYAPQETTTPTTAQDTPTPTQSSDTTPTPTYDPNCVDKDGDCGTGNAETPTPTELPNTGIESQAPVLILVGLAVIMGSFTIFSIRTKKNS